MSTRVPKCTEMDRDPPRDGYHRVVAEPKTPPLRVMLVDDAFATIGSCNIRARSFFSHTEMNASIYDPVVVRALRRELLFEHLHVDTGAMEDTAALRLCAETAQANTRRQQCGDPVWQGIAFALEPASSAT